jgi:drug/metabolite transporter (DMT)-like permease
MKKWLFAAGIIGVVAINGNTIEFLVEKKYSTETIMVYRGGIALGISLFIGLLFRQRQLPVVWSSQLARLAFNGISALLLFESYKYLSATSVGIISRADLPLMVLISFLLGYQKSSLQFWLSLWTLLTILYLTLNANVIDEGQLGFLYAFGSVVLVSFSYLIVKKSTDTENTYVLSNINAISLLMIGGITVFFKGSSLNIDISHAWIFLLTGLMQFLLYYLAFYIYKWYVVEKARLPFVIGAISTMGLEMLIEQKIIPFSHMGLTLLITGMLVTICLDAKLPSKSIFKKLKADPAVKEVQ